MLWWWCIRSSLGTRRVYYIHDKLGGGGWLISVEWQCRGAASDSRLGEEGAAADAFCTRCCQHLEPEEEAMPFFWILSEEGLAILMGLRHWSVHVSNTFIQDFMCIYTTEADFFFSKHYWNFKGTLKKLPKPYKSLYVWTQQISLCGTDILYFWK